MLIQKMKSTCSIKIEANGIHLPTGQLNQFSLYDTSSIAVINYNVQHDNILHKHLLIEPLLLAMAWRVVSQPTTTDMKDY